MKFSHIYCGIITVLFAALSPSMAVTCLYNDATQFMKGVYQGETIFNCDTITVSKKDTAVLMKGARFLWNKELKNRNKVLIVKGSIIGVGSARFAASPDRNESSPVWDGIVIDSCANADFARLIVHDASFALHIRSGNVRIGVGEFIATGGVLLPDSSVLRKAYERDTLQEFYSAGFASVAQMKNKCEDESQRIQSGETWKDYIYSFLQGSLLGLGISGVFLTGYLIWFR